MLGNGVTPGAGAAPLWPELPNLAQNINLTQKWEKAEMQPIHHKSGQTNIPHYPQLH